MPPRVPGNSGLGYQEFKIRNINFNYVKPSLFGSEERIRDWGND